MSLIVDEHRQYLSDHVRVAAFRQAIHEVVKPGDVVVDLGAGTGILGLLACQAGAARVYAIESGGMIEVARSLARANGFQNRVTFIPGHSPHVEVPEKADVVVADQIGRFGFEAGVVEFFADARRRFLKPSGTLIPSRIEMTVAPVEHLERWAEVEFWRHNATGFDLGIVREWAINTGYPVTYQPEHLLGPSGVGAVLDLPILEPGAVSIHAELPIYRAGTLHGIGGWFAARLSAHSWMTNGPLSDQRINRQNVLFPINQALSVVEGDRVVVDMTILPLDVMVTWRVTVTSADGQSKGRFVHSTLKGMLTTREDMRRTHPDFVPHLVPRGQARMTVLSLCDGQHTLAAIEHEVYRRHPALFQSVAEAATFVAEVVTRYAR
ncbi:MAG: methyltransferase domain-containing protein [Deltaproteobacteria bacterium]|nr:methyltransferase domain-containing protein [Deltaproteobacteria bacterium]